MSPRTREELISAEARFSKDRSPIRKPSKNTNKSIPIFPSAFWRWGKPNRPIASSRKGTTSKEVRAYAIKLGHAKEGCGVIAAVVVSLAGTFIWGRTKVQRENGE